MRTAQIANVPVARGTKTSSRGLRPAFCLVAAGRGPCASQGPYAIAGVGLGDYLDDKEVLATLKCAPSEVFHAAQWCQRNTREVGPKGPFVETLAFLRSDDGKTNYSAKIVDPAYLAPDDVENEITRLSRAFGQATVLRMPPRPDLPHCVIASWGGVVLAPLDSESVQALAQGTNPKVGFIVDFIGDFKRSAQQGLPLYVLKGTSGLIWNARLDDSGKGVLRISAIDASKLTLI